MNYNDYKAAVDRLRQLDLPDNDDKCKLMYGSTCYLPTNPAVRADKVLIYDAEHDQTPATVKWIVGNFGGEWKHGNCLELKNFQVWDHADEGVVILDMGHSEIENPTRGDVLTALRLFKKGRCVMDINTALGMVSERPLQVGDEVAELREQLADVTRERDEARREVNELAELLLQEKNKLATVQAQLTDWMDTAEALYKAVPVAYERGQLPENGKRKPSEMVKEYLAELQAEAAAMRNLADDVYNLTTCYPRPNDDNGYELSNRVTLAFKKIIEGTAGRELLDEMQRKEERIKELEAECESSHKAYEKVSEAHDRLWRKCNAAKLAYIATLRGKIDPAWFGERSPVWQYRKHSGNKAVFRGYDGIDCATLKCFDGSWKPSLYKTWQACCDDPATYPCDENGKRIEEVKMPSMEELDELCTEPCKEWRDDRSFADEDYDKRIADLERQLTEHKRDAELCRELRALLSGVDPLQAECDVRVVVKTEDDSGRFLDVMKAIRDGGAK